jgi:hypothetical protein
VSLLLFRHTDIQFLLVSRQTLILYPLPLTSTTAMATATVALPLSAVPCLSPAQASPSSIPRHYTNQGNSPTHFILPDLVSHCKFPLAYHPDGDKVTAASTQWLIDGCPELSPRRKAALQGLQVRTILVHDFLFLFLCPLNRPASSPHTAIHGAHPSV